jgi:hypothetical protein
MENMRLPVWLGNIIVAVVSLLAAFFGVFNVLFSDRSGIRDAEIAVSFILIIYGLFSLVIHLISRRPGWVWWWWLVVPGLVLGLWISVSDGLLTDWYAWTILVVMLGATTLGRWIAHTLRPVKVNVVSHGSGA